MEKRLFWQELHEFAAPLPQIIPQQLKAKEHRLGTLCLKEQGIILVTFFVTIFKLIVTLLVKTSQTCHSRTSYPLNGWLSLEQAIPVTFPDMATENSSLPLKEEGKKKKEIFTMAARTPLTV